MDQKLYLSDPGIYRKNGSKNYYYNKNNVKVTNQAELTRLNKLVVPPGWKDIWYSSNKKSHIQVHGIDQGGKKQYILSSEWINNRTDEKFMKMQKFVRLLPSFKRNIFLNFDSLNSINKSQLIKLLLNLIIDTHIRIGNEIYADKNKTYGLTTLRQKHLVVSGSNLYFSFVGKSSQVHKIQIPKSYNRILLILKLNNKNNNKLLFYYDSSESNNINSDELNEYIKNFFGSEYTCKDFRTYSANMLFIQAFLKYSHKENSKFVNKIILKSMDYSAHKLGHTRSISKKSYISSKLVDYCTRNFNEASQSSSSDLMAKLWT